MTLIFPDRDDACSLLLWIERHPPWADTCKSWIWVHPWLHAVALGMYYLWSAAMCMMRRRRSHGRGHVPLDSSTAASSSTEADPSSTGTDAVCIYTFVHMQRTKPACIRRRQSAATSSTPRQPTGVHVRGLGLYALHGTNFPRHDHGACYYSLFPINLI